MDAAVARWLVGPEAVGVLRDATAEADPDSLRAAERLRRVLPADRAAAVLAQVSLRRRAVAKFGEGAAGLFLTVAGLEQATRPDVARWRAGRLQAAGVQHVIDLGCGIGADASAFRAAGLRVSAVEADEGTAVFARANLGQDVLVGDAVEVLPTLASDAAVFCDPARRTSAGRSWRIDDLSPSWGFVEQVLTQRTACVKLGPGLPHAMLPARVGATWVSHRGELVELALWSGRWQPVRQAVLLPGGQVLSGGAAPAEAAGRPVAGGYLLEPDPAVIRAGLVDDLAATLGARRVAPGVAYLTGPEAPQTPFATTFEIVDVLDAGERSLRAWVRSERIGTLEIKKRGVEVDPAALRRRLKPAGPNAATLVLTPTPDGARALVVRRMAQK